MTLTDFFDKYNVSKKDREYADKVYGKQSPKTEEVWKKLLEKSIRLQEPKEISNNKNNKTKDK